MHVCCITYIISVSKTIRCLGEKLQDGTIIELHSLPSEFIMVLSQLTLEDGQGVYEIT